jgi:hypothetical protein
MSSACAWAGSLTPHTRNSNEALVWHVKLQVLSAHGLKEWVQMGTCKGGHMQGLNPLHSCFLGTHFDVAKYALSTKPRIHGMVILIEIAIPFPVQPSNAVPHISAAS